jgi:chemotaxis protein CheC
MLTQPQLAALTVVFGQGSEEASSALSRWLDRPACVTLEPLKQLTLAAASEEFPDPERPICCCVMDLTGRMSGHLLMAFDDSSGLALADLLLGEPIGTSTQWGEIERSAVQETANIIGCAYLNSLARCFPEAASESGDLLPSPPRFVRDFAESLIEFALMDQAMASDVVFLTRNEFHIEGAPVSCRLMLVPDVACLARLRELLPT